MKYLAILLLIMSFAGIGIYGFGLAQHDMQGPENNCVASTIDGTVCPMSIMSMTLHHISAVQSLTTTTVPLIGSWLLLLAFASLAFISLTLFFPPRFNPPKPAFYRYRLKDSFFPPQKQEYLRWLALHENSPTTFGTQM